MSAETFVREFSEILSENQKHVFNVRGQVPFTGNLDRLGKGCLVAVNRDNDLNFRESVGNGFEGEACGAESRKLFYINHTVCKQLDKGAEKGRYWTFLNIYPQVVIHKNPFCSAE